ncbi:LysM peptidoglycan-binding domain-containing protein [Rickettsiales endosymbiont of Peranema trichophorum]|uniref:LysM peptidoglycan-binding domain-containing protein n=1 Tax=Rickettsiales endosymbiont of Peranema trichophorum TaxID=2486577 RepID=UPI0010239F27|nr:LysM peptidoglycan-binding domain-containing protein [Rickettsiales endosymbiont of Peranema trichophorum]RZI45770.1 LysM peptidoglycan-binding domain-containing protein [Rickettsiales endosymbiont of Peranema trichophorum]
MAWELSLIDLIYDHEYYCQLDSSACHLSWEEGLNYFKEQGVKACTAPNEVFTKDPKLLYSSDTSGYKKCELGKWNREIQIRDAKDFTIAYLKSGVKAERLYKEGLLVQNIWKLSTFASGALESALRVVGPIKVLKDPILEALAENGEYQVKEETIKFVEGDLNRQLKRTGCQKKSCDGELKFLTKLVCERFSGGDVVQHGNYLLDLATAGGLDKHAQHVIVEGFGKQECSKSAYDVLSKHLDKQLKVSKCAKQSCDPDILIMSHYINQYSKEVKEIDKFINFLTQEGLDVETKESAFNQIRKDVKYISAEKWDSFTRLLKVDSKDIVAKSYLEAYKVSGYVIGFEHLVYIEKLLDIPDYRKDAAGVFGGSAEREIRNAGPRTDFSKIEGVLDKLFEKIGLQSNELPKKVISGIFDYYSKDQGHFTKQIVNIVAEVKEIETGLLMKLEKVLLKIPNKEAAAFVATRLSDHHLEFSTEELEYFIKLASDNQGHRLCAINFLYGVIDKVPVALQKEVFTGLLKGVSTDEELRRLKGVSEHLSIDGKQKRLLALKEDIISSGSDLGALEAAARDEDNFDYVVVFLRGLLWTQDESALESFRELRKVLEQHRWIEWSSSEKGLLGLVDDVGLSDEKLINSKRLKIGNSVFLLKNWQYKDFEEHLAGVNEVAESLEQIVFKFDSYKSVLELLAFIKKNNVSSSDLMEAVEQSVKNKELYEILCNLLLKKQLWSDVVSGTDKKVLVRSYNILDKKLGWSGKLLYSILKVGNIALLERIGEYHVRETDTDRDGKSVGEIILGESSDRWLWSINRIISDNRFFIPKVQSAILREMVVLNEGNEEILELLEDGYYEEKLKGLEVLRERGKLSKSLVGGADDVRMKPLDDWRGADFIRWKEGLGGINDTNIVEALYVVSEAVRQTYLSKVSAYPRDVQIVAVLSLYKSEGGGLAQIATGEGKSLIIGMFNILKMLEHKEYKRQIDIVTSSRELAIRDAIALRTLYDYFEITVSHNIKERGTSANERCYEADIVYGDAMNFIGDTLRDISKNTKMGRGFDLVIVDEVDNLFVDQSNMKIQLTSTIYGMEMLGQVLVYLYGHAIIAAGSFEQKADGCYYKHPVLSAEDRGMLEDIGNGTVPDDVEIAPIYLEESCTHALRKGIANFTETHLLADDQPRGARAVEIPTHLEVFAREQINNWVDSFFGSIAAYQKDREYIVIRDPSSSSYNFTVIAPVDAEKTGVIQFRLQLADGLQQFLQLKHDLTLTVENIVTTFMSYYGFFSKYKGNIYGLTGTLGDESDREYLRSVYGVKLIVLPTFIQKDLVEFEPVIVEGEEEWRNEIVDAVVRKTAGKRAVLVIIETLDKISILHEALTSRYPRLQVGIYGKGGESEKGIVSTELGVGDVILASNLAGRGTDLKLSPTVMKNGGLHVVVGTFPSHVRVEEQAYGRSARQGEPGSAQMIINTEHIRLEHVEDAKKYECRTDIECLKKIRREDELISLTTDRVCRLPIMELRDNAFNLFVESLKGINSPTGYRIVVGLPEKHEPFHIYVYKESGKVFVKAVKQDEKGTIEKTLDESQLRVVDRRVTNHIKTVLMNSQNAASSLNRQDFELINYVCAVEGFTFVPIIVKRIDYKFDQEVERTTSPCITNKVNAWYSQKNAYLHCLHQENKEYKDLESEDKALLSKIELRRKFELWLRDRELYNTENEIKQASEYFGMWLKRNDGLFAFSCDVELRDGDENQNISSRLVYNITQIRMRINEISGSLNVSFANFSENLWHKKETGEFFENPTLLVLKAWKLMGLETGEKSTREALKGSRGVLAGMWIHTLIPNTWIADTWAAFSATAKAALSFFSFGRNDDTYMPASPIDSAISCLNSASELEPHYSWSTYNALAFAKLMKDGQGITKQKQAAQAMKVKSAFITDTAKVIERIINATIPVYEAELTFLLAKKFINYDDDIAVQHLGTIFIYQEIVKAMEKNIEFVLQTSGKQMVRMGRHLSIEEITANVIGNITEVVSAKLSNLKNLGQHGQGLSNITVNITFDSYKYVVDQITGSGGLIFELESYGLEKESKNWWGTVAAAAIGVLSIVTGLWIMSGTVFTTAFGGALVLQGIGEIIGALISVGTGNPIDFEEFMKSKGMSIGISLATAGTLYFLSNIPAIEGVLNIAGNMEKLSKLAASKTVFLATSFGAQALTTGLSALVYNGMKHAVDQGHIESEAREAVAKLIARDEKLLRKIFATDYFCEDIGKQSCKGHLVGLLDRAVDDVMRWYLGRFNGDEERAWRGYGTEVGDGVVNAAGAGTFGLGAVWSIVKTAGNVVQGVVKSVESVGKIIGKMHEKIVSISSMGMSVSEMLFVQMKKSFKMSVEEIEDIKVALSRQQLVVGGEILVECDRLGKATLSASLSGYKTKLVNTCKQVSKMMDMGYERSFNKFKEKLISSMTSTKIGIEKQELVKPLSNGIGSISSSLLMDSKIGVAISEKLKSKLGIEDASKVIEQHQQKSKEEKVAGVSIGKDVGVAQDESRKDTKTKGKSYIVQKGDTLSKIAEKEGTTVDEILSVNKDIKDRNLIYLNQKLVLPEGFGGAVSGKTGKNVDTRTAHEVKRGESLWDIWRAEGLKAGRTWAEFREDNAHLADAKGSLDKLKPGDKVYIVSNKAPVAKASAGGSAGASSQAKPGETGGRVKIPTTVVSTTDDTSAHTTAFVKTFQAQTALDPETEAKAKEEFNRGIGIVRANHDKQVKEIAAEQRDLGFAGTDVHEKKWYDNGIQVPDGVKSAASKTVEVTLHAAAEMSHKLMQLLSKCPWCVEYGVSAVRVALSALGGPAAVGAVALQEVRAQAIGYVISEASGEYIADKIVEGGKALSVGYGIDENKARDLIAVQIMLSGAVAGKALGDVLSKVQAKVAKPKVFYKLDDNAHYKKDIPETVDKIGDRYPINAKWAGKTLKFDSAEFLDNKSPENIARYLELAKKYPNGVFYDEKAFVDLKPYSKMEVQVPGLTGKYAYDVTLADKIAQRLDPSFVRPETHTWHHHQDGLTMLMVPRDLHSAIPHTGGAAILRQRPG